MSNEHGYFEANEAFRFSLHVFKEEGVVMSLSVNIAAFRLISREISRDLGKEIKRKRGRRLQGSTSIILATSKQRDPLN